MLSSVALESAKCPSCMSEAIYQYGKAHNGKKRYICQVCNRQFILDTHKLEINKRPVCNSCGAFMHVYMRNRNIIRFRCSGYPECKTYYKDCEENLKYR